MTLLIVGYPLIHKFDGILVLALKNQTPRGMVFFGWLQRVLHFHPAVRGLLLRLVLRRVLLLHILAHQRAAPPAAPPPRGILVLAFAVFAQAWQFMCPTDGHFFDEFHEGPVVFCKKRYR